MNDVIIYSDGASRGNPGNGGYGTIVKIISENNEIVSINEFTDHFDMTTNNRMELLGVIQGFQSIKDLEVNDITIHSDSKYVIDAYNKKWIVNWMLNDWKTSNNKPVKNQDLWNIFINSLRSLKNKGEIKFIWIKGHNGHPENERCDLLATASADGVAMTKKDGIYYLE